MAGQRPREINVRFEDTRPAELAASRVGSKQIASLLESALNRFATLAEEDDVITVATYERDDYIYLDVCRHRRNFPPVEHVAGFGRYQETEAAYSSRPGDVFLRHAAGTGTFYAADVDSLSPAYLSFKFPVKDTRPAAVPGTVRLLAIDDQPVILDLISAMGQSLGYDVTTVGSGEAGLRTAESGSFDIVLADQSLSDISGLEIARRLRQQQGAVSIILMTGWDARLDRSQLAAAGITDVLVKPFRIEQLTRLVQSAVTRK